MFDKQPLFNYSFTIFDSISAFLKKFSQNASYSIFDKPFIPNQKLSKVIATTTSSVLK